MKDFKPSPMNHGKGSVAGQLTPVEYNRLTVSETVSIDEPTGGYMEMLEYRNSARGYVMALEDEKPMEGYLETMLQGTTLKQKAYGTLASSDIQAEAIEQLVSLPWKAVVLRYFAEEMRTTPRIHALVAVPYVRTELQLRFAWCMMGLTREEYDSEERKRSKEEKVFLMTNLRDLIVQEGAAVACAKRRDALCFIRFLIEQISVPALNTCVKMLREGDERTKALFLLALLDMQQSKPMRVNMKEPEELEPMKKIDEIRRFSNKELRLTKESMGALPKSSEYCGPIKKKLYGYVSGIIGIAYNPFLSEDIRDCFFDYEQAVLLRFWTSGIVTIKSINNPQAKLGLVLEEEVTAPSVPKSDKRVEFGLGFSDELLRTSLMAVWELMRPSWCPSPNADSILRATQDVQRELNADCNLRDLNIIYNVMITASKSNGEDKVELPGWGPDDWVKPGSCLAEVCGLEGHVCGGLDCVMDLAEAYVGPMVDAIYRRLIERDFALEDPEVVMLLNALINILGHDNRGDRPTEVLLMAAYGERGVLDRPNMRVIRWRNGALSGSDLANEPGLGSSRTYQPGEMPMPSKPKPGLTRMHREMNSEATSSGSPLRAAVPPKRAKVTQKVQTNQTIQYLDEMNDQLRSTKKELDEMTESMLQMEEDRDMWRKLFEDCNKKQGQEIERLRQEYKERSEQLALTTAVEKVIPARDIPRGQSPMELLTPREMSQTTETRLPAEAKTNRVTIPDPSDTLGDPVVEQTVRRLIETAGRLVANKNAPGSGVTAPYGTIDDTGRVQISQTVIRQGISNVTPLMGSSRIPERKARKMPAKKVSRIIDVQKNNQLKYNFTGVPETDPRACFNRATWSPAVNLQQPPLGTSHLILGDSLVRVLSNLRTSWVTTVIAFGGATIAQLYRMVELMNPGKIPNVMILVGTNDISRGSDEQEALWESMMVCLFTTLWQKFSCAVLTVCTVPMNTRSLTASGRRHNEGVIRWNNILRNLASQNAGRMILMDIEHELRAMDQARLTTDGIHFDSMEGQAWLNRVFQERLDELEAELFDTGVLKEEGTVSDAVITTFVPPSLETRLGTVPAVTNYRQQSSSEPGRRTDVQDRLGEAPMRRTIHPRRIIGPVNPI